MSAIPAFHVELKDSHGHKVGGIYQWRTAEDANEYAATMRGNGYTAEVAPGPLKTQNIPARQLWDDDVLANGGVVISRLYFGRTKVRVTGLALAGGCRLVRRSYGPDQLVEIEARR
jgi:hypothetical protein